jgi:hypothetical protein
MKSTGRGKTAVKHDKHHSGQHILDLELYEHILDLELNSPRSWFKLESVLLNYKYILYFEFKLPQNLVLLLLNWRKWRVMCPCSLLCAAEFLCSPKQISGDREPTARNPNAGAPALPGGAAPPGDEAAASALCGLLGAARLRAPPLGRPPRRLIRPPRRLSAAPRRRHGARSCRAWTRASVRRGGGRGRQARSGAAPLAPSPRWSVRPRLAIMW